MMLVQALQYPLRGKGSLRRILILALLQLLPIVGQLILYGYGFDVARAVYAGQADLPPIRWRVAPGNGLRFFLAGLGYLLPILITIGIEWATIVGASSIGSSKGSSSNLAVIISLLVAICVPGFAFLIRAVVVKQPASSKPHLSRLSRSGFSAFMSGLLPIIVMVLVTLGLNTLVSLSGLKTGHPNGLSILVFALLALSIFLIVIVLYMGCVHYARESKGLLAPMANAKLLLKNRALTGMLFLNVILLAVITVLTTIIGLVLLIVPGLCAFVICSLAMWYLFAQYSMHTEAQAPALVVTDSVLLTL